MVKYPPPGIYINENLLEEMQTKFEAVINERINRFGTYLYIHKCTQPQINTKQNLSPTPQPVLLKFQSSGSFFLLRFIFRRESNLQPDDTSGFHSKLVRLYKKRENQENLIDKIRQNGEQVEIRDTYARYCENRSFDTQVLLKKASILFFLDI